MQANISQGGDRIQYAQFIEDRGVFELDGFVTWPHAVIFKVSFRKDLYLQYDEMVQAAFIGRDAGIVRHPGPFDAAGGAIRLVLVVPFTGPGCCSGSSGRRGDRSTVCDANGIIDHAAIMASRYSCPAHR